MNKLLTFEEWGKLIMTEKYICSKCKRELDGYESYEYRGVIACEEHFDEVCEMRDYERNQLIKEDHSKTDMLKGLDLSDSVIGKANREIFKAQIEIASNESYRLKSYEGRL